MRIRKARKEDARRISLLKRETLKKINSKDYSKLFMDELFKKNNIKSILKNIKERDVFCLIEGVKILGVIDLEDCQIWGLYINSKVLGKGYRKILIEYVEDYAKKKGKKKIIIYPTKSAKKFYEKLGYKFCNNYANWIIKNEKMKFPKMEKRLK
jgi:N-acetylglutamate synthase-like GNAT family acetyltransferase